MERRPYFVLGDLLVNVLVGALAASAARGLASIGWHPLVAMLAGMVAGMLVAVPVTVGFMPLFGAFEVMLPGMFTGMFAGMAAGMIQAMHGLTPGDAVVLGSAVGVLSLGWVYFLTARAGTERRHGSAHRA